MRSCARLQRSLSLAGFNAPRPAAHFYSTKGAASQKKSVPSTTPKTTPLKAPKTLRGSRLERVPDDFGYDQWAWNEVNLDDKTIQTAAGDLPISPLLDPRWHEARERKKTKARPDKKSHGRFQRQLRQNPYAQLLATPVRLCPVTRTHLPQSMMQSFGLVRHPKTDKVWWIPEGVHTPRKPAERGSDETREADDPSSAATEEEPGDKAAADADGNSAAPAGGQTRYRYPMHVLSRQDLIRDFARKGNMYFNGQQRSAGMPSAPGPAKSAFWRPDMDGVILDQRRRDIMDDLLYLATMCADHGRKYIIRVTDAKYSATYVHRAAFLWLGEDNQELDGKADKAEVDPEQYATLDIDGDPTTTRPVYNLPRLLGPANVARLRAEVPMFKEGSLFLLRSQRSGPVNKKLWSLQGYVAHYSKL